MAEYATEDQVKAYLDATGTAYEDADVTRLIDQCEREVDNGIGVRARDATTGLRYVPANLVAYKADALARAVGAQVEYHLVKGEGFFAEFRPQQTTGRDYSVAEREPYLAPKARMELSTAGLMKLTAGSTHRYPWGDIPNQNVDDIVFP